MNGDVELEKPFAQPALWPGCDVNYMTPLDKE
jgi:hypothetical protein